FREAGDDTDLRFDAAENRIDSGDPDAQWTVNIANLYQTYLQQPPSQRAEYVRSTARGILTSSKGLPKDFELVRADLRPRLWLRGTFEQLRLRSLLEGAPVPAQAPPCEAIGEHLFPTLAYDWPEA